MLPTVQRLARSAACDALEFPARAAPLLATLASAHDARAPGERVIVCDLVWQTAPSPELARAFAPEPGREKVRPVEGYEM